MHTSELLFDSLERAGWGVSDCLLPMALVKSLRQEALLLWEQNHFSPAHVGRTSGKSLHQDIRGDSICWLDTPSTAPEIAENSPPPAIPSFLSWAQAFRERLNERYYLGLTNEEFHFARYPSGTGYGKHLDQHRGRTERKISVVLYLNETWFVPDGGQLVLYYPKDSQTPLAEIVPALARMVIFRSDLIPHEVLPCFQTRWSLTGWFRSEVQSVP